MLISKKFLIQKKSIENIQNSIIKWFHVNQRPLAWRKNYSPYEVWISEIMLQQTQVNSMLSYYQKFINQYPDLKTLSKASYENILQIWSGLGYYKRAENIYKTAKIIAEQFEYKFPNSYENIIKLPGIGKYTAHAILSIAFEKNYPVLDANVKRVSKRILSIDNLTHKYSSSKIEKLLWKFQENLIPQKNIRSFNQGLMELGALICKAKNPKCIECPIQNFCKAHLQNEIKNTSIQAKKKITKIFYLYLIFSNLKDEWLIQKRTKHLLLNKMWDFPNFQIASQSKTPTHNNSYDFLVDILNDSKISFFSKSSLNSFEYKGSFDHKITKYHIKSFIYHVSLNMEHLSEYLNRYYKWLHKENIPFLWVPKNLLQNYLIASLTKKVQKMLN